MYDIQIEIIKTNKVRERVIWMLQLGLTQMAVAAAVNNSQQTVSLLWHRFEQIWTTKLFQESDRSRLAMPYEDRFILLIDLLNRFLTAIDAAVNA